ncbi:type II toxin-antitoxin system Phd/YefM family antitoxin [Candidatus Neomicrothrix sp.]|jgi:prevent-host-death family protein|uniref:Type II toxin-antitoxin system prevent-host-death family antitoxin n=1 Tax=Candidatus Neomicrothrix subdominans TaxID=2954438 RepID=A0A936NC25_9ACTN|nr:type II toxin-antitoxin system prevent-host-death family antitoxin [Candidatus Microthrix sp.]MBK6968409.1 type II toxin-antitoxin system prevent-host-death family antitoxin [Candidatus Microthrix sp.]MBK7164870.1 type II toxin-antitoxin system prevent-host-death family antitoxin [Candidatus Microthrix sp.]MBK9296089.1 type II toxin-antitoxin system prevent-host-death family antitoxin [Candidatus Microthrix subdominans]HMS48164.1 type II toxin-antitoxin system prevent-host-death family antit
MDQGDGTRPAGTIEIGVRRLRSELAALVRRAGAGERVVITVAGRPVAQLGPVEPTAGPPTLADLIARGDVDAPRRADRPEPSITVPTWAGVRLDTLVREVRGR